MKTLDEQSLIQLAETLEGDLATDLQTRTIYSTAACIYKIMPLAVAYPKDVKDVITVVNFARKFNISVTARGGGSSRTGAPLNSGIILNFSRYMNGIIEVNTEQSYVVVEPGIVLSKLNSVLNQYDKHFGVDPTSSAFCSIGGMVANNSAGAHSLKYGTMKDNVLELKVVLSSGEILVVETDFNKTVVNSNKKIALIITELYNNLQNDRKRIMDNTPNTVRNCDGYNVWDAINKKNLDLISLFSGSEGTLGILVKIKIRIHDLPKKIAVFSTAYYNLSKIDNVVNKINSLGPSAFEIMEKAHIAMRKKYTPELVDWITGDPDAIVLVEFDENEQSELDQKIASLNKITRDELHTTQIKITFDKEGCDKQWLMRKNTQKLKNYKKIPERATAFVEDLAFDPSLIGTVIQDMRAILKKHNAEAIMSGHAGVGSIHLYPLLNLKNVEDCNKLQDLMVDFEELTRRYKGCISGEHGIGIVRTESLRKLYQENGLYTVFQRVKESLDPTNLLNPEKIVSVKEIMAVDSNLRYGPDFKWSETGTLLDESYTQNNIDWCHGCGKCLSFCPIHINMGKEEYTPRSLINLLRSIKSGELEFTENINNGLLKEFTGLCINCKTCETECFDNIDAGDIVSKVKSIQEISRRDIFKNILLCNPSLLGKLGSSFPSLSNICLKNPVFRKFTEFSLGIDRNRLLPDFESYKPSSDKRRGNVKVQGNIKVLLFSGCYLKYYNGDLLDEIIRVLIKIGCEVVVESEKCCGLPLFVNGNIQGASKLVRRNSEELSKYTSAGYIIATSCSSCAYALKNEYRKIAKSSNLPDISQHVMEIHELLLKLLNEDKWQPKFNEQLFKIGYHSPCHMRGLNLQHVPKELLLKNGNIKILYENNDCCGMGGTWGLKKDFYPLSKQMASKISEKFIQEDLDFIVTSCSSCQMQLREHFTLPVLNPIQILRKVLI